MSFPGGIQFTNSGFLLSSKTLIGKQVIFTRLAVGDGELSGQSPLELNSLIHEVESIDINKLQVISDTDAVVGGPFTNQGLLAGFWWREIGLYATDPDTLAEKLYCYGNAGALADYIPAGGGAEILEKQTDIWIMASATDNIAASINSSLVYASAQDLTDHVGDGAAHGATVAAIAGALALRDANGRIQVGDPSANGDAVNKGSLELLLANFISGTNAFGTTVETDANSIEKSGFYAMASPYTNCPTATGYNILHIGYTANAYGTQIASIRTGGVCLMYVRTKNNGVWSAWSKLWNADNDGPGSGLNADMLGGKYVSELALVSHAHAIEDVSGLRDELNSIYYSTIQQNYTEASVAWAMAQLYLPGALPENSYTFTDVFSSDAASEALVLDPIGLEVARTRSEGIHRYIAKKAGVTVSSFDNCAALAANSGACSGILNSSEAMDAIVSMSTAYLPFVASSTAMNLFAQNAAMLTRLFANYTIREAMYDGTNAFAALQAYARAWMVANVQVTSSLSVTSATKTWKGIVLAKAIGLELTVSGTSTKRHATWKTPECADIGDGSLTNQFAKLTVFDYSCNSSGTSYTATATAKYVPMSAT